MNIASVEALLSMALVLFGAPADLKLLTSEKPACEARNQTAEKWRAAGYAVFTHEVKPWCIVASIHQGTWQAEQWTQPAPMASRGYSHSSLHGSSRSHGWSVSIALAALPAPGAQSTVYRLAPGVELQAFHYPGQSIDNAHQQRLLALWSKTKALPHPMSKPNDSPGMRYRVHRMQRGTAVVTVVTVQSALQDAFQIQLTESQP